MGVSHKPSPQTDSSTPLNIDRGYRGKSDDVCTLAYKALCRCLYADFRSMTARAANVRSTCGCERGPPECSTQRFPAGTPQVGQGTDNICLGVSSFFFIEESPF